MAGQAAGRFAVRNSGPLAVIEGAGNHCREYMTGGVVLSLGPVGRNFGAGMSHGVAYVLDESGSLPGHVNRAMVDVDALSPEEQECVLGLIHEHRERTGSARARQILQAWPRFAPLVLKVVPHAMRGAGVRSPAVAPARPLGLSPAEGPPR